MAKVHSAGDNSHGENPHVTSKFDRDHGEPRTPGKVSHPGGEAQPSFSHSRHEPTSKHHDEHGTVHHYAPDHPAMAGLEHGAKAKHPMHDKEQAHYEEAHGYSGASREGK